MFEINVKQTNIVIHLGKDKSELSFTWFSESEAPGEILFAERLINGAIPADARRVAAERTGSTKPGYFGNKLVITGLLPGATYYYQLVNGADRTSPEPVTIGSDGDFSFAVAGDPQIGRGYGKDGATNERVLSYLPKDHGCWGQTLEQLVTAPEFAGVDFLMTTGDQINTHMGSYLYHELQFDAYANHEVLLRIPTVLVLGNHDAYTYPVHDNHVKLPNMLIDPATGTYYGASYIDDGEKLVFQSADYYFTYNNVLFLVLNVNTYYYGESNSSEHLPFIDRVMAETADRKFDWIITLYHLSPYGSSYHHDPARNERFAYIQMRSELVPKLYEIGVDLILSGHDHCYTRTFVLKPGKENGRYNDSYVIQNPQITGALENEDGIVHVTAATSSASQVNADKFHTEPYKAVTATADNRHLSRIEVTEDTLTMVTYNLGAKPGDSITEVDRFAITNNAEDPVEAAIAAIGAVTQEAQAAVKAARAAYEALSPQLKKRVKNLQLLTAAEAALSEKTTERKRGKI